MDRYNLWRVLFLAWVTVAHSQTAGPTRDISPIFQDVENDVKKIAQGAIANVDNSAALLATCNEATCSKHVCTSAAEDAKFPLSCVGVPQNTGCAENNLPCNRVQISTMRSYVRLPPTAPDPSKVSCDMASTVCVQRALDDNVFQQIKFTSNLSFGNLSGWAFFGSSNGIFRSFPGSEERNVSSCVQYDPRQRPWYKSVFAISKEIVLLLDTGPGMAVRPTTSPINLFGQAADIVSELLDTLVDGDNVTVYNFNSSGAEVLIQGASIPIVSPKVKLEINGLSSGVPAQGLPANLTSAIMTLSQTYLQKSTKLRTILILTSDEVDAGNLPVEVIQTLLEQEIRVFIYQLLDGQSNNGAGDLLKSLACRINASYEAHTYDAHDPLAVVKSFYSYVAYNRLLLDGSVLWTPVYEDYSDLGMVVTASFPAIVNNTLIGVAGIDVILSNIPYSDTANLPTISLLETVGTTLSCNLASTTTCVTQSVINDAFCHTGGIVYSQIDEAHASELLKERRCCKGQCGWKENSSLSKGVVAGIVIGSIVVVLILLFIVGARKKCGFCARKPDVEEKPEVNNGTTDDDLLAGGVGLQSFHGRNTGNENSSQRRIADPPKGYFDETL